MSSKKVLMIAGDFVEDMEVYGAYHAFQLLGIDCDAVCPGKKAGETVTTAMHDFCGH